MSGVGQRSVVHCPVSWRSAALMVTLALAGCGAATTVPAPEDAVRSYLAAVRAGDAEALHALLDAETRAQVSADELVAAMAANEAELSEQADAVEEALGRGTDAQARVPLGDGERAVLIIEDGRWRLLGGVLDAPALRTPRDAVLALRRALRRRSMRGMSRVLAREPRAELEAEILQFLEDTEDDLDLEYEVRGSVATVRTSSGREVHLIREAGEWRVLEVE